MTDKKIGIYILWINILVLILLAIDLKLGISRQQVSPT